MAKISNLAIDLIEAGLAQSTAGRVGAAFFQALQPFGARAIFARAYRQGAELLDDAHIFSRISPPGWENLYAEKRFQDANFVVREVRTRLEPFNWSNVLLQTEREREISNILRECGFGDGLAMPCHGPAGYLGLVSLAFEALPQLAPADRAAIQFASLVLHNHMHGLSKMDAKLQQPRLSHRERDCVALIAEGHSDSEIGDLLGISETTVHTHVKNARLKLGAKTRAQAVARLILNGLL